jgi:hypothetical protein
MPIYKKFIVYLKNNHIDKLHSTNNVVENYIGNTMPKAGKRIFRTDLRFFNQIYHRFTNWIGNVKNQLTF